MRVMLVLVFGAAALALSGCGAETEPERPADAETKSAAESTPPTKDATPAPAGTKVPPDTKECSKDVKTAAATMKVTNRTSKPVDLYWFGFDCKPVHYATIKPGGTSTQDTFVDHRWAATSGAPEPVSSHSVGSPTDAWDI